MPETQEKTEFRPIIGLTAYHDRERATIYLRENYLSAVSYTGGLPFIIENTEDPKEIAAYLDLMDGLILTGGCDICPERYGAQPEPKLGTIDPGRDAFEFTLLGEALRRHMPVLGICRGCQLLNVYFGGKMIQDIETAYGIPYTVHSQTVPYTQPTHDVVLTEGGFFAGLTGQTVIHVNSSHHQAVVVPGKGMRTEGWSDDGIREAFVCESDPTVFAVQFHPEHMAKMDEVSASFFRYLNRCARIYHEKK